MFTLGRAVLRDPDQYQRQGDRLVVSGLIVPDRSLTDDENGDIAHLVAGQVLGLNDRSNVSVVSITWAQEPTVDGWYELDGDTSIEWIDTGHERPVMARWSAALRAIRGFASARHESSLTWAVRSGTVDLAGLAVTGRAMVPSWPDAAFGSIGTSQATLPLSTGGTMSQNEELYTTGPGAGSESVTYLLYPADAFVGVPRLEVLREGGSAATDSDWYPLVGAQEVPASVAGRWRLTNDLVRLTAYGRTDGDLELAVWTGSTWVTTSIAGNSWDGTSHVRENLAVLDDVFTPAPVTVNRNDIDVVSISLPVDDSDGLSQTYSLRRGCRYFEVVLNGGSTGKPGLRFDSVTACSTVTKGVVVVAITATAATSGVRPFIASSSTSVRDVTNGYMAVDDTTGTGGAIQYGIGWNITADSTMLDYYLTTSIQTTEIVAR